MKFDQDKAEEIYSRRSPHGERGLKLHILARRAERFGRSPHGERGLKFLVVPSDRPAVRRSPHGERGLKSHPMPLRPGSRTRRSPHGERGLKCPERRHRRRGGRRSPHGERGLKYDVRSRGFVGHRRSPHGERGLKYCNTSATTCRQQSLSSRRAWIEIPPIRRSLGMIGVALLTESVD